MFEFFPQHKEEEKRLKKGDPKGDKKGRSFRGKPFIPANEIPDPESYQNIEERIDFKKDEEKENNQELVIPKNKTKEDILFDLKDEYFYEKSGQRRKILKDQINRLEEEIKEEQKQEKLSNEKMSKEVKFFRRGDVAHVGPDVENIKTDEDKEIKAEKVFQEDEDIEKSLKIKSKEGKRFKKSFGGFYPKFLSKSKNISANVSKSPDESKAYIRMMTHAKSSNENLKTMPESKKERSERGEIKKNLNNPKNKNSYKKFEPMDSIEE